MPTITFEGREYGCQDGETVLDCLTRHEVSVPSSCRSGVCQTCMLHATSGQVPELAQNGLKDTLKAQNFFLACSCVPTNDLTVALPALGEGRYQATVLSKDQLADDVIRLRLKGEGFCDYQAGQFLTLFNPDGVGRNYSLASLPSDDFLELHVRCLPAGKVSGWVAESLQPGDTVELGESAGDCFYIPGRPEQNIALIATGTGLAPLYGIVREALKEGHQGEMVLFHGVRTKGELYLHEELRQLAERHANLKYLPCVSSEMLGEGYYYGRANDAALQQVGDFAAWRVYLCGNAQMVETTRKKAFLAGASFQDIYSDPFIPAVA